MPIEMLDILCSADFNSQEIKALDTLATLLGKSREEVVRLAVRIFAGQCVPTHPAPLGGAAFSRAMCTHTSTGRAHTPARRNSKKGGMK